MLSGYREARRPSGSFWRSVLGYAVSGAVLGGLYGCAFAVGPSLVVGLTVQWRGGFVLDWYAVASGLEPGATPDRRLERAVKSVLVFWFRDRRLRWVTLGVIGWCILAAVALAGAWRDGAPSHQNRSEQMPLPTYAQSNDIQLSPDGEWLAIRPYYDDFEVWRVGEGRRMDTVPWASRKYGRYPRTGGCSPIAVRRMPPFLAAGCCGRMTARRWPACPTKGSMPSPGAGTHLCSPGPAGTRSGSGGPVMGRFFK